MSSIGNLPHNIENLNSISQLFPPLHYACYEGDLTAVKKLLNKNNINQKHNGHTPLYIALSDGNVEVAKYLIKSGADIHTPIKGYGLPIKWALETEWTCELEGRPLLKLFVEKEFDVFSKDENGKNILQLMCEDGEIDTPRIFSFAGLLGYAKKTDCVQFVDFLNFELGQEKKHHGDYLNQMQKMKDKLGKENLKSEPLSSNNSQHNLVILDLPSMSGNR